MRGVILFLWISLLVFLNVRGGEIDANPSLCEHCNNDSIQECLEKDSMVYNFTVNCQRADQTVCRMAFADENSENIKADYMCFITNSFEENKSLRDAQQRTTMMLDTATENFLNENNNSVISDSDIKITTEHSKDLTATENANEIMIENLKGNVISQERAESTERTTTQNVDLHELPQGDQPMPEMAILDAQPTIDMGNNIESKDKEHSKLVRPEVMGMVKKNELEMNTVVSRGKENPSKCFQCKSTEDSDCIIKPSKEMVCKAEAGMAVGCYTLFKDEKLMRGCLEDLDELQRSQRLNDDKTISICYGNMCNEESWPQCYVCISSPENSICSTFTPQSSVQHLARSCSSYDDLCQVEVTENGATVRSCVARSKSQSTNRMTCNTTLCNAGIFPKGRLSCHQCHDTLNCDLEQPKNLSLPCPVFKNDDSCFFYANAIGKMKRGCSSSIEDLQQCLKYDQRRCVTCSTSDGCNSPSLISEPRLKCIQCDTRIKGDNSSIGCTWAQSVHSGFPCRKNFFYYLEESCETINQPDIELTVRGCSNDIGNCESGYDSCTHCKSNTCNVEGFMRQNCLQCTSEANENCGNAKGMVSEKCNSKWQPYKTRGCYTRLNWETNITARGCIIDLSTEEKNYCNANGKLCVFCYEHGCNNQQVVSAGNQVIMENGFRVFLLALIYSCL